MDVESLYAMKAFLESRPVLVFDTETSGVDWFKDASICGIALGSWDVSGVLHSYYIPFRHRTPECQLELSVVGPVVRELLGCPNTLKVAHNLKFDEHMVRKEGWDLCGPRYDTMIAARLYDENRNAALKGRAVEDLGRKDAVDYENRIKAEIARLAKMHGMGLTEYKSKYGYSQLNIPLCGTYACFDIEFTAELYQLYEQFNISRVYDRIWTTEMDLTSVLCDMEQQGMVIDVPYLESLRDALGGVLAALEDSIQHQLGGVTVNIGSDAELRKFLTKRLGLRLTKKTKGGQFAVDKDVLSQFVSSHPVLQQIIDWKEAEKLYSTYTRSILERLDKNQVLHTDFQQVGTFTGRLSCMNPNLQNQPSDSDDRAVKYTGKKLEEGGVDPWSIRRAYCNKGAEWVRLLFDYSQIELRVLAFYTRDPVMVDAYMNNEDIHSRTSMEVFGTKEKAKRRLAKVINFGLSYGMAEQGFAAQTGITLAEATEYLQIFFERYKGIPEFKAKFYEEVRQNNGYFQTIFGRPRRIPNILSPDDFLRKQAERRAMATLIQGSAAELTKESLVRVSHYLKQERLPAYLVSTVHDELQLDCHVSVLTPVCRKIKQLMEDFPEFSPIPIVVDGEYTVTNWAEKIPLPM
jgi:DNA polymerase-1